MTKLLELISESGEALCKAHQQNDDVTELVRSKLCSEDVEAEFATMSKGEKVVGWECLIKVDPAEVHMEISIEKLHSIFPNSEITRLYWGYLVSYKGEYSTGED